MTAAVAALPGRGQSVSVARLPRRSPVVAGIALLCTSVVGYACGADVAQLIDADLRIQVPAAAVAGAATALLLPQRAWKGLLTLAIAVVTVTALGTGGSISAFVRGLGNGWRELLSTTVLAPDVPSVRVVPLLLAFAVAWASGWLHLRHRQGLAPLGPVVVGIASATALGGNTGELSFQTVREILVPVCGLLILRSVATGGEGPRRSRPTRTVALVVVAGVLGAMGGVTTAINEPDHRDRTPTAGVELIRFLNPTQIVTDQRRNRPDVPILRTNLAPGTDWRLVTMDLYRPSGWDTATPLLESGSQLVSPVDAVPGIRPSTVSVQVLDKSLPLLPLPDRTTRIDIDRVLQDPVSGAVRVDPTVYGRVISLTVEVHAGQPSAGVTPSQTDAGLERYRSLPSGDAAADQLLPALFAKSTDIVEPRDGEQVSARQRADAIARFLRGPTFSVDDSGGSGTLALVPLTELVIVPGERTARPEQYVTIFALLARLQGLPVRIVAGYRGGVEDLGGTRFLGRHAALWPEVHLVGSGWVAFDPVPERSGSAPDDRQTEAIGDDPSAGGALIVGRGLSPATDPLPANDETGGEFGGSGHEIWQVLLVLILGGTIAGADRIRRVARRRVRARTTGTDEERVMAAWRDALGSLTSVGVRATPAMTADEVVAVAGPQLFSNVRLRELAVLTNLARYAPVPVAAEAVAQAWSVADAIGDEIAAAAGIVYRARRAFGVTVTTPTKLGARPSTA